MNTDRALYEAILANPDDDLPRLVYADWLEENGQSDTAAFIRVQCELARTPQWEPLWVLCSRLDKSWLTGRGKSPPDHALPAGVRWASRHYRRGFPCRVRVEDLATAAANAEQLFGRTLVDGLEMDMRLHPDLAPLMARPEIAKVRLLEFHLGSLTADQLRPVLDSPHAGNVHELRFLYGAISGGGLRAVLTSPLAAGLRELRLGLNFFTEYGRPLLAAFDGVSLPHLERLDLTQDRLGGSDLRRILEPLRSPRLARLELTDCHLSNEGVSWLNEWAGRRQLTSLNLSNTELNLRAAVALASGDWPSLRVLTLANSRLGPKAAKAMVGAGWLGELRILDLNNATLSDNGVKTLVSTPAVGNLLALDLRRNAITDPGAKALLDSPHLANLIHLNVDENAISDEMRAALQQRFGPTVAKWKPTYVKKKR